MINSADVQDLQLEDVEDYSADYPPSGYPQSENIAAVGMPAEGYVHKKRTNSFVALIRNHKWTSALGLLTVIILIVIVTISGGSKHAAPMPATDSSAASTYVKPTTVNPKSVNPAVAKQVMDKLTSVYSRYALNATVLDAASGETPQRKAFYWLAAHENLSDLSHTQVVQRYTLAVFYYATNAVPNTYIESPRPWVTAHLWLSKSHTCEWSGITCNSQDHVTSISLERNGLSGSIPMELAFLGSTLETFDLTSNTVYMDDPLFDVFLHLTQLTTLLMDDNYLLYNQGLPSQFKKMGNIKKIRLSYNLLSGELEKKYQVLANMAQLTHLEIESNFLSGTMPNVIGQMSNLVYLYMRRNKMTYNLDFLKTGKLKDLCK